MLTLFGVQLCCLFFPILAYLHIIFIFCLYFQDYLGGIIVFVAIITALFTAKFYPHKISAPLVGLAINYTLLVPIYLNWVVKLLSDMEMYIGAVERISHYVTSEDQQQQQQQHHHQHRQKQHQQQQPDDDQHKCKYI